MAKGLYLMPDGQVLVEYGRRRRVPIPPAQYKANGYRPPCDKLPAEAPRKVRKELAIPRPKGRWLTQKARAASTDCLREE